ncbi:MAG: hypothetical protein AAF490_23000 [Chloroflexota bacterium]
MGNQTSFQIFVESRRKKVETIEKAHTNCRIIDLTSKATEPWVKFSPFYPHGDIPVPFSAPLTAQSVEGIWQGLKVFETAVIDPTKFDITAMKGLKRTVRRFGPVLGHQKGINSETLLDYLTARQQIYLPSYQWVLQNRLQNELIKLKKIAESHTLVFLDYETNEDILDLKRPLSHAGLVKKYLIHDTILPTIK